MKILRSLNKKIRIIISILFLCQIIYAEEQPVDIWNLENNEIKENSSLSDINDKDETVNNITNETDIFKMQLKNNDNLIKLDEDLVSKEIKIFGLYDPEENGLDIDMWSNSDGDQLKSIFAKLNKIELSADANEIMKISILTNSYSPKKKYIRKRIFEIEI